MQYVRSVTWKAQDIKQQRRNSNNFHFVVDLIFILSNLHFSCYCLDYSAYLFVDHCWNQRNSDGSLTHFLWLLFWGNPSILVERLPVLELTHQYRSNHLDLQGKKLRKIERNDNFCKMFSINSPNIVGGKRFKNVAVSSNSKPFPNP